MTGPVVSSEEDCHTRLEGHCWASKRLPLPGTFMYKAHSIHAHHVTSFNAPAQVRFAEATGFDGHGLALEQPCDPLLAFFYRVLRSGAGLTTWAGRRIMFGV